MELSFPVFVIQLLGGSVFVLSTYVIYNHVIAWKNNHLHLLPLHVWLVSVSYNFLVLSLMFRVPRGDVAFIFGSTGLLLGIYSLGTLATYQRKRNP